MKKPRKLSRIFSYISHYGLLPTAAHAYEKLVLDKKRFSAKKRRAPVCDGGANFPSVYDPSALPPDPPLEASHILYLIHYFYPERRGGTERFTLNLARKMKNRGADTTVLVLDANLPPRAYTGCYGGILYREYEYDGIRCIGFRHKKAPRGLYYKNITEADCDMQGFARYIIERYGIDFVHATYPQPFVPFLFECRSIGIPYIVTCTDFAMECHYATLVDRRGEYCDGALHGEKCARVCKTSLCPDFSLRYKAAREALLGARAVTVPSDFVRNMLLREFDGLSVTTVNHGISEEFKPVDRRGRVRRFLYAGTLSPLKGIHLLLSAFSRLEGDFELLIAGKGDERYERELRRAADGRVKFIGAVDAEKMPELYSSADCVVVPSMWYETYNFVLREAQSTGALVIASDIGAMPEAVDEGENGFLFEPCNSDSLLDALKKAADFDFACYKQKEFPTVDEEADIYSKLYRKSV